MTKLLWIGLLVMSAWAQEVMTWQPYYSQAAGLAKLDVHKNVITRLGLQFWYVNNNGTLTDKSAGYTQQFVNKAKQYNIDILITPYNADTDWNWPFAKSSFTTYRATFVRNLLKLVDQYDAAGIDLDLEGKQDAEFDYVGRYEYSKFVRILADSLHKRGKILTVDTYPYVWNGPHAKWWQDWIYVVDAIHVMGYEEIGSGATGWRSYKDRQDKGMEAGYSKSKIFMGLPSYKNSWLDTISPGVLKSALTHVRGLRDIKAPIAIWDLPQMGSTWSNLSMQSVLKQIKDAATLPDPSTAALDSVALKNMDAFDESKVSWASTRDDYGSSSYDKPYCYFDDDWVEHCTPLKSLITSVNSKKRMHNVFTRVASSAGKSTWGAMNFHFNKNQKQEDFTPFGGLTIRYSSNYPFDLSVVQRSPDAQNPSDHHKITLPATNGKEKGIWVPFSSLAQVSDAPLKWQMNIRQVYRLEFTPELPESVQSTWDFSVVSLRPGFVSADTGSFDGIGNLSSGNNTSSNSQVLRSSSEGVNPISKTSRLGVQLDGRNTLMSEGQWSLYNLAGELIFQGEESTLGSGLNKFESGVYLLRVKFEGISEMHKVILE
jgi:hypothetical protein